MSTGIYIVCERLLSATANGVYQGVLVALLVGIALRLFARTNAATRHAVWFGVLLFVAALIPAHFLLAFPRHQETPGSAAMPGSGSTEKADASLRSANSLDWPVANRVLPKPQYNQVESMNVDNGNYLHYAEPQHELAEAEIDPKSSAKTLPPTGTMAASHTAFSMVSLSTLSLSNVETSLNLPRPVCWVLVSVWIILAGIRGGQIARQIIEIRANKAASEVPSFALQVLFERLRGSLETKRKVRLRVSRKHQTAILLGFFHPVILLPAEMDLEANEREVEHVLRHELAHLDRRDDGCNLIQQIIQAALCFHPAVWWISSRLSLEREIACDDQVLQASDKPREYALTLANVAARLTQSSRLLAPGVTNNKSQLQQRITMILNSKRNRSPRLARTRLGFFTTGTALLAFIVFSAGPRLILAQSLQVDDATTASAGPTAQPRGMPGTGTKPNPILKSDDKNFTPESPAEPTTPAGGDSEDPRVAEAGADSDQKPTAESVDSDSTPESQPAANPLVAPAATPGVAALPVAPEIPVRPTQPNPGALSSAPAPMSVEERLDRIERILGELERQNGANSPVYIGENPPADKGNTKWFASSPVKPGFPGNAVTSDRDASRSFWREKNRFQPPGPEQGAAAQNQALRALEDSQLALEDSQNAMEASQRAAEQAMGDLGKLKDEDFVRSQNTPPGMESDAREAALKTLQDSCSALQAQIQSLRAQIKRLEEDRTRLGKPGRSPGKEDEPTEQSSVQTN